MGEALIGDRVAIIAGAAMCLLLFAGSIIRPTESTYLFLPDEQRKVRLRRARVRARVVIGLGAVAGVVFCAAVLFLPMAAG